MPPLDLRPRVLRRIGQLGGEQFGRGWRNSQAFPRFGPRIVRQSASIPADLAINSLPPAASALRHQQLRAKCGGEQFAARSTLQNRREYQRLASASATAGLPAVPSISRRPPTPMLATGLRVARHEFPKNIPPSHSDSELHLYLSVHHLSSQSRIAVISSEQIVASDAHLEPSVEGSRREDFPTSPGRRTTPLVCLHNACSTN